MDIEFTIGKKQLQVAILILVIIVVSIGIVLFSKHRASKNSSTTIKPTGTVITVTMTADGFSPKTITITAGDTVKWVNNDTRNHWPASDPHPTHDYYPGFDALKGLAPGESWDFVFLKPGDWTYHDHLIPHLKGEIVVNEPKQTSIPGQTGTEISQLLAEKDPKQQAKIVHAMAEKYGTLQALAMMRNAGLPFTGETHLLVHEIGNVAYEKYGDQALQYCDDSFLSACYHGVILNELGDHGLEGLVKMVGDCKKAAPYVMAQCSHAAGHGFLAWKDYKVLDALPYCDKIAHMDPSIPTFNCYDGVFMENIFGVHDGTPSPNRMIHPTDLTYPCSAVPEQYKNGCYADQATLMYQLSGGDLRKVAAGCDALTNAEYKATCYNNFARQIHPLTQGKADIAVELCKNATGKSWQDECLITIANAAFSVGDLKDMPYKLCAALAGSARETECYEVIYANIGTYAKSKDQQKELCGYIANSARSQTCLQKFSIVQ